MLYNYSMHIKQYDYILYLDKEEEKKIENENAKEELKQADPDDKEDIEQIKKKLKKEIEEIEKDE